MYIYFLGHGVEGRTCPAPLAWDGEGDSLWHCSGPDQGIDLLRFSPKMHLWLDLKKTDQRSNTRKVLKKVVNQRKAKARVDPDVHLGLDHASTASSVYLEKKQARVFRIGWHYTRKAKMSQLGNLPPKNATVEPFELCPSKYFSLFSFPFHYLNRQRLGQVFLRAYLGLNPWGVSSWVQPHFSTILNPDNILPRMLSTYCK